MQSISFLLWIFDLALEIDAWLGSPHDFLRFRLSSWIYFSSPVTIGYKKPFRFCLWSSCSHVKKRRSTSLGLSSCGTQYTCFCTIPIALRRFQIAGWVTPKVSASSFWVWHESWSNNASNSASSHFTGLPSRSLSLMSQLLLLKRRNQYSHVFIDGAYSPCAAHSNRCPLAVLFF